MAQINNVKAQNNNITHYRGDVFDEVWQVKKSDGSAYNLSGKTVRLAIRKKKQSTTVEAYISNEDSSEEELTIGGAENNEITFDKIIELDERDYYYDCEVIEDDYTISYGIWSEIYDVVRTD